MAQRLRLFEVASRLLVVTLANFGDRAWTEARASAPGSPVRWAALCAWVDGDRLGEVTTGIHVAEERGGQVDGVLGPVVGGGVRDDGDQAW